ncbi:MAG: 16S rRNA (guanine(966)-N(2))-methyltransferase RsmD [Thermoanaerobaculia bacterium]
MKISGGALRGRSVRVPRGTRPTSGRAREALFSRWQATISGCRFLDLFAGSGGIGLEAVSRGAELAVFVELDRNAAAALRRTCRELVEDSAVVLCVSAVGRGEQLRQMGPFEHVFADPPYDFESYPLLLERVGELLDPQGEAAIEHSSRTNLPDAGGGLIRITAKRYGESLLSLYRASEPASR